MKKDYSPVVHLTVQARGRDQTQFLLESWLRIFVRDFGAVRDHHVVEQIAEVRLVDLRRALHGLRREPDLMADQFGAGSDPAPIDLGRDRVGVLDRDIGPGFGELHRLFALLFRPHQNVGGFLAVGIGKHDGFLSNPIFGR